MLAACGDDSRPTDASTDAPDVSTDTMTDVAVDVQNDTSEDTGADVVMDTAMDTSDGGVCTRGDLSEDKVRFVVVSLPFETPDDSYAVHRLALDGTLSPTGNTFRMARAFDTDIAFSLDGAIGMLAQDDGTLGIFQLAADGSPSVIESGRTSTAYASRVYADPNDMNTFWYLSSQTRSNGGGVYRVTIDCDGSVLNDELVFEANLPYGMGFTGDGQGIVMAKALQGTVGDVFRVDLTTETLIGSAGELFPADDWIGAGFALGGDHVFGGDNSGFSSDPNSIAAAPLEAMAFGDAQRITEVEDPTRMLLSPFEDKLIVISGFANAFYEFDYDAAEAFPLSGGEELAYVTGRPALPGSAALISRGSLRGLAVISENVHLRSIRFEEGNVTDLGRYDLGSADETIPGALGVQP